MATPPHNRGPGATAMARRDAAAGADGADSSPGNLQGDPRGGSRGSSRGRSVGDSSGESSVESHGDSRGDSRWIEQVLAETAQTAPDARPPPADRGMRRLVLGLLAAVLLLSWLRLLASGPHLALDWVGAAAGAPALVASPGGPLQALRGRPVVSLRGADGETLSASAIGALQAPRDIVSDAERRTQAATRQRLDAALQSPGLALRLADGSELAVVAEPRGLGGMGAASGLLGALALALLLAAGILALARPGLPALLFAAMAGAQSLNLLLMAGQLMPGLGQPAWLSQQGLALRWAADLVLGAAWVHLSALYPQRLARPWLTAGLAWGLAALLGAGLLADVLPGAWWWAQGWTLACGLGAALQLRQATPERGRPLARLLQRLTLAAVLTLALLTAAQALADLAGPGPHEMAVAGSVVWQVFLATLLLLGPFLARTRQGLRQLALLAGISTVTASLALLLETGLALGAGTSLLLAVVASAALYTLARRWVKRQLAAAAGISAERLFDQLYRVARALERSPEQAGRQIRGLLREVFDPLQASIIAQPVSRVRVTQDGSTLVVPLPALAGSGPAMPAAGSVVLRHARQGRRLFSADDQRLAERMIEQLGRAVAYDRAVEQGRTEERTRIAQDLHDDIGARLLTLMYKAPNAEIEEYIRHTLQDLKTLTRGLAASNHRLSHAAAEWKADLSQRLTAVGCDLRWSFSTDHDITLNVVQWSGLTRVLRELVNNIISHARASQVEVSVQVDRGQLVLTVHDDGIGRAPEAWSHGLGLGGVRKRVKLLGGQVRWLEAQPRGIRCEVRAPLSPDPPG